MSFLIFNSEVINYGSEPIALNIKTFYIHSCFSASLKNQVKFMLFCMWTVSSQLVTDPTEGWIPFLFSMFLSVSCSYIHSLYLLLTCYLAPFVFWVYYTYLKHLEQNLLQSTERALGCIPVHLENYTILHCLPPSAPNLSSWQQLDIWCKTFQISHFLKATIEELSVPIITPDIFTIIFLSCASHLIIIDTTLSHWDFIIKSHS